MQKSNLIEEGDPSATEQLLLDAPEHGWRDAEQALDRVRDRFGHSSVRLARLLDREDPYRALQQPAGAPRQAPDQPGP